MQTLWEPTELFTNRSNLNQYQQFLLERHGLSFENYEELWQWSTDHLELFWESLWEYFDIISYAPYRSVLLADKMPGAKWFDGAMLNYAEHLFRHENAHRPALIFTSEKSEIKKISWQSLRHQASCIRNHLINCGVQKGDRVVGYLPNIPETVISFIAVNSIGAIWSCCSMDFGEQTVVDRFTQIKPKVLIAADGYFYKEKVFDRTTSIKNISEQLDTLEQIIVIPYLGTVLLDASHINFEDIISSVSPPPLKFEPVSFNDPIWVLYSSGTTGKPKAITHSHGGVLLEHLKYLAFHNDVKKGEHFFWFTTTGWMMWNFLQASMLVGATPVLYEGNPAHPDLMALWRLAEDLPIHHFGTSAPYLTALMNRQLQIDGQVDLSQLRSIGSTGAPLPPETFKYIYQHISKDIWLCSMSGGTDVCTAFVGGVPSKPVLQGRIQGRSLGVALKAYTEDGLSVRNELGEMVIEKPLPSMPIYFWNDPDDQRYLASYFTQFPGKWRHGDYINIYDDGSLIIQGRSDATLNRKGIRIGTAEIYNALDQIKGIADGLILNLERDQGDVMPLFLVLEDDFELTEHLVGQINSTLRTQCSPRHVPDKIVQVPDIPYTLSGKKMEVPIKKIFVGLTDSSSLNKEAIRNPTAIDYFVDHLHELKIQIGL